MPSAAAVFSTQPASIVTFASSWPPATVCTSIPACIWAAISSDMRQHLHTSAIACSAGYKLSSVVTAVMVWASHLVACFWFEHHLASFLTTVSRPTIGKDPGIAPPCWSGLHI